jgi:chorismate-pyruvate lyase
MNGALWRAGLLALTLGTPIPASAAASAPWPETPAAIDLAKARLTALQQQLMSQPSATLVLAQWCATYHLAPEPEIRAKRVPGTPPFLPERVRLRLRLKPGEVPGYRRVQLLCGDHVLSDAENWYVPSRLTPEMNQRLDQTDTPFGLAVRSLHFKRRTLSSEVLWLPPTQAVSGAVMTFPDHLLRNEALLTIPGGLPISLVIENYTAAILGAPP